MQTSISIKDIPKEPAVRRAWVQYQLRLRGLSFRSLARQHGISNQSVSQALLIPSAHIERILAEVLGVRVEDLFPERFDATGRRLHKTVSPKRSTAPGCGQRQKRGVA